LNSGIIEKKANEIIEQMPKAVALWKVLPLINFLTSKMVVAFNRHSSLLTLVPTFNYCYDCGLYKTRKTFVYQKKP
jgi:hypothetical protein